jgi:16S rRNA (guanine527-N7)-methyltransferase
MAQAAGGPLHGSAGVDERLRRWLRDVLDTPGLTAIGDHDQAWAMLVEDALRGKELVAGFQGPLVDVGSGAGSPGIPLAAALPEREVTLLEANARKARFLERAAAEFPNVKVLRGRAEEQEPDHFGVAVAKALAPPAVALEWCLPLVRPGGAAVLWVGPSADFGQLSRAAEQLGGGHPEERSGLAVVPKVGPTPPGFPRRVGVARKRPLA